MQADFGKRKLCWKWFLYPLQWKEQNSWNPSGGWKAPLEITKQGQLKQLVQDCVLLGFEHL